MPITDEQLRNAVLSGTASAGDLAKQIVSLTPAERTSLEKMLSAKASHIEEILQLLSTQAVSSRNSRTQSATELQDVGDLRVGDIVRSNDQYWLTTGRHLTGAIVRFEAVPESQIPVVGSRYWAHLNSGEGPIGTSVLEKVCLEEESLRNLMAALGSSQGIERTKEIQSGVMVPDTVKL